MKMFHQSGSNPVHRLIMLVVLPMVCLGFRLDSPDTLDITTNSNDMGRRVSQLEQTVVKQQGLIMDLVESRKLQGDIIRDCSDVYAKGNRSDGVHTLRPTNSQSFPAYCQFDNEGLWTVIQRRMDGSVDFHRSWIEYKNGFGVMDSNFWLGNDNIHTITNQRQMTLRIEITDWDEETRHADYKQFGVDGEDELYRLHYDGYTGTAGDSLDIHQNMKFSTLDQDNDNRGDMDCAGDQGGGWWFNGCDHSNLNGFYHYEAAAAGEDKGVEWHDFTPTYSFKETIMKIKPAFPN